MFHFWSLKPLVLALALFGIVALVSGTAKADVVVIAGANNQGTDPVLLNFSIDVLTVTGRVGQNNVVVNFTSSSGSHLLGANASGLTIVSGGVGNFSITQMSFGLANNDPFTRAVFTISTSAAGSVVIQVEGINISGGSFTQTFPVAFSGFNDFTVTATNGQLIQSISLTAINGTAFAHVRDVRLGGGVIVPTPEPTTMLLLGTGLLGVAAALRRRFRR